MKSIRVSPLQVRRNSPAFPARWFTAYSVISPVRPGFFVTVIGAMRKHCHQLGTCVGAPGPHDFAVRIKRCSSVSAFASIASRSTFRDDRDTPLCKRGGTAESYMKSDFWKTEIFLRARVDRNSWSPPVGRIGCRSLQRPVDAILRMHRRAFPILQLRPLSQKIPAPPFYNRRRPCILS